MKSEIALQAVIVGLILFMLALVIIGAIYVKRYDPPLTTVMLSTDLSSVYGNGNSARVQSIHVAFNNDKMQRLLVRSRLFPYQKAYSMLIQTNGTFPNPTQEYQSILTRMGEGLAEIYRQQQVRTVSGAAFLRFNHTQSTDTRADDPNMIGFQFGGPNYEQESKGFLIFYEKTGAEWEAESGDSTSRPYAQHIAEDIQALKDTNQWFADQRYVMFSLNSTTRNFMVNTDSVDGIGPHSPYTSSVTNDSSSQWQLADVTIWFDSFWSKAKKSVKHISNDVAHGVVSAANTVAKVAVTVAEEVQSLSCGPCRTIHEIAFALALATAPSFGAEYFCAVFATEVQLATVAFLEVCPQCEMIPVTGAGVCLGVTKQIIKDFISLTDVTSDDIPGIARRFCKAELLCAS